MMNDSAKWYGIGLAALPLGFVVLGLASLAIFFLRADDDGGKARGNVENAPARLRRQDGLKPC